MAKMRPGAGDRPCELGVYSVGHGSVFGAFAELARGNVDLASIRISLSRRTGLLDLCSGVHIDACW